MNQLIPRSQDNIKMQHVLIVCLCQDWLEQGQEVRFPFGRPGVTGLL